MFDPSEPTRPIHLSQWELNALILAWEGLPITTTEGHLRWMACRGKLMEHQAQWKKELEPPPPLPPSGDIEQTSIVTKPARKKAKGNAST